MIVVLNSLLSLCSYCLSFGGNVGRKRQLAAELSRLPFDKQVSAALSRWYLPVDVTGISFAEDNNFGRFFEGHGLHDSGR